MLYKPLGSTGIEVSIAGLGTGGRSALGTRKGASTSDSIAVIDRAIQLGVRLIDTSEHYGTEPLVGKAIGLYDRSELVISTKAAVRSSGERRSRQDFRQSLASSLTRLGTDHVDIFSLHAVLPEDYEYARDEILPALVDEQATGRIGLIGISEAFDKDATHRTLSMAVDDACWNVLLLGFNLLNQAGRESVLQHSVKSGTPVIGMCAVRHSLMDNTSLNDAANRMALDGNGIVAEYLDKHQDLATALLYLSGARSVPDMAYRFAVHEPGISAVLFGTSRVAHVDSNVESLVDTALPAAAAELLCTLFST